MRNRCIFFVASITIAVVPLSTGCVGEIPTELGERRVPEHDEIDARPSLVGEPNRYLLIVDEPDSATLTLDLDKQKALALFGPTWSRRIRLLDVPSRRLLEHVIQRIRNACGTQWRRDSPDPDYDCTATELGRTFGAKWRESAEFAVVRLLGMTPANASLIGTKLEDFAAVVDENPNTFRFDFAAVLAESLGIARTDPFIKTDALVLALQQNLLATHPAIKDFQGRLPVTLYDALLDLQPLAEEFGSIGQYPYTGNAEHPGVLLRDDHAFTTRSNVLQPDFRMRVTARSNLRHVRGVSFTKGAGEMFISLGKSPLSFDFLDPEKLDIRGIEENPTIDMRLQLEESPKYVERCDMNSTCRPHFLDAIVRSAAKNEYNSRVYERCHVAVHGDCLVGVDIGKRGIMPGFATFTNELQGVTIPSPRFVWDLLTEVAHIALHDPNGDGLPEIADGHARPVFALQKVPIGFRGPQLVEQMRPMLQSQADLIADVVAGKYWEHNDDLDVFVDRHLNGLFLFFVAPSDERPDEVNPDEPKPYNYSRPGFYAKPDLSESSRISAKLIHTVMDEEHEKIALVPGTQVVYAQNEAGDIYELTIFVPEDHGLTWPIEIVPKNIGRHE